MRGCLSFGTTTVTAGIAVIAVGGCYFTTDFGGLSGGGSANDAGSEGSEAGGVSDGGKGGDAPPVKDNDAGSDGSFVCPPTSFCDGFEGRTDVLGLWDKEEVVPGCSIELTTHARTGSGALRVTLAPQQDAKGRITKAFPQAKKVRVQYAQFFPSAQQRGINLATVQFDYPTRGNGIFVVLGSGMIGVAEQELAGGAESFFKLFTPSVPVVAGRWVDVDVDVDLSVTPPLLRASYDGASIASDALSRSYPLAGPVIFIGASFAAAGPMTVLDIDDVIVTVTPP